MYFIRRNLLLGLAIVLCYLAVILYSDKLEGVSLSTEAHVYGTEQAYGRAAVDHRVSLSDIRDMAQVKTLGPQSGYTQLKNAINISSYNEFSSVTNPTMAEVGSNKKGSGVQANMLKSNLSKTSDKVIARASVTARLEALRELHQQPSYKVKIEKRRVNSVLNLAIFFLGGAIMLLVLTGDNHKREFDKKMVFLSALILIDFVFIGGQFTMLMPLIGLAVLYGRHYLSNNFTPHEE
ncbi:hypothetical protein [Shewanella violacea]|uniref:Uncharacterized protein n=1 Tax=Shewanella violacea (strain JCM 10179 / CIP 106290 / LMG 19151 / DSS12) TaxID=637905 RepID=D4ZC61_SHEVD|nr:hypothetical protein [Shewanella violacea]BAJ03606.1 hypothetical protein SVI_3635 [Shewanella violacea DSS12]